MARKPKTVQQGAIENQQAVVAAADTMIGPLKTAALDRAEQQLTDFFLNGGFHNELALRLTPMLAQFTESVALEPCDSAALLTDGTRTIDAECQFDA